MPYRLETDQVVSAAEILLKEQSDPVGCALEQAQYHRQRRRRSLPAFYNAIAQYCEYARNATPAEFKRYRDELTASDHCEYPNQFLLDPAAEKKTGNSP